MFVQMSTVAGKTTYACFMFLPPLAMSGSSVGVISPLNAIKYEQVLYTNVS